MEMELSNGEKISVVMKGKHRRKALDVVKKFNKEAEENYPQFIGEVDRVLLNITKDATGLTEEQMDNLDLDDLNKLIDLVKSKCYNNLGFQTP